MGVKWQPGGLAEVRVPADTSQLPGQSGPCIPGQEAPGPSPCLVEPASPAAGGLCLGPACRVNQEDDSCPQPLGKWWRSDLGENLTSYSQTDRQQEPWALQIHFLQEEEVGSQKQVLGMSRGPGEGRTAAPSRTIGGWVSVSVVCSWTSLPGLD